MSSFPIAKNPGAQYLSLPQIMETGGTHQVRDISSNYWFSALQPVKPVAPKDLRPRQWQYQPGANIIWQPGAQDTPSAGFRILREVAESWDLLRLVLETVKDRLCTAKWELRLRPDPGEKNKDLKNRAANDKRIGKIKQFLMCPDGVYQWPDWLRMLLDDILVLDAGCIYLERDLKGRIASLRVIDGGTINRCITDQGFVPADGKSIAFQQVLYGLPAIDLTTDDLVYVMHNPRTWKRYGFGPVEQMLVTISIGLSRQRFQLNYYTEGNIPEGLVFLPSTVPPDKILELQTMYDTMLSGNLSRKGQLKFLPGYGDKDNKPNIVFPKEPLLKDEMDEYLFKVICYNLGVSPQNMIKQMNRASAQQSQETAEEEGLVPKLEKIAGTMNFIIQKQFGFDDIEFAFVSHRETDVLKQMQVDTGYLKTATILINEVRENLGLDPLPTKEASMPGVITQNGFIPLAGGVIGAPGSGSDPIPQPDKTQQPAPGAEGGPPKPGQKKPAAGEKKPTPKGKQKQPKKGLLIPGGLDGELAACADHDDGHDPTCFGCVSAELERIQDVVLQKAHGQKKLKISPAHNTPATMQAKHALQEVITKVFRRQKDKAADAAKRFLKIGKAEGDDEEGALADEAEVQKLLDELYKAIGPEEEHIPAQAAAQLEAAAQAGIGKGLIDLQISDVKMINAINIVAADWARERGAEMVGMKYDLEGNLLPNPNAKWVISDTTREQLKTIVIKAFEEETNLTGLVDNIRDAGAFQEFRAEMIARTEVAKAQVTGNYEVWKQSGVVESVQWLMSEDHDIEDECDTNDDEVVAMGETFPSGDDMPPLHPNCMCELMAVSVLGAGDEEE